MHSVLSQLLEDLEMAITESEMRHLVEKICTNIANRASVQDILEQILEGLPAEATPEQQSVVEATAEMLHSVEEPGVSISETNEFSAVLLVQLKWIEKW